VAVRIAQRSWGLRTTYALLHLLDEVPDVADGRLGRHVLLRAGHLGELNLLCLQLEFSAGNRSLELGDGLVPQILVERRLLAARGAFFLLCCRDRRKLEGERQLKVCLGKNLRLRGVKLLLEFE
jgi:hypothetical protein